VVSFHSAHASTASRTGLGRRAVTRLARPVAGRPGFRCTDIDRAMVSVYQKGEPRGSSNFPPGSKPQQEVQSPCHDLREEYPRPRATKAQGAVTPASLIRSSQSSSGTIKRRLPLMPPAGRRISRPASSMRRREPGMRYSPHPLQLPRAAHVIAWWRNSFEGLAAARDQAADRLAVQGRGESTPQARHSPPPSTRPTRPCRRHSTDTQS
jgi:hypothetical protein